MPSGSTWSFRTNEAYDMILFLNAISDYDFYSQYYSDVRANWIPKIGSDGLALIKGYRK